MVIRKSAGDNHFDLGDSCRVTRPKLSDFASIKYRNEEEIFSSHADPERCYREIVLPDKLELAMRYCENVSFKADLRIVLDTIKCIFCPQITQIYPVKSQ